MNESRELSEAVSQVIPHDAKAFGSFIILTLFGLVGGYLVKFLHGYKFPKFFCFPGYTLKPIIRGIQIPPLLGMILFGFIARNYFGGLIAHFPNVWASYLRSLILATL